MMRHSSFLVSRYLTTVGVPGWPLSIRSCLRLASALIIPLMFSLILLVSLGRVSWQRADAAGTIHYVAPGGSCGSANPCYGTVHAAVMAAQNGDEIRVAQGTYTDVHTISLGSVITQVVYISRSLMLRGGYTTADWTTSWPLTRPTILDARGLGRVVYVSDSVTVTLEGFILTNGVLASGNGAGVYFGSGGNSLLYNSRVYSNAALSGIGGGVYVAGGTPTLQSSDIYSNAAGVNGGGVAFEGGMPVIDNSRVYSNSAVNGGGILFERSSPTIVRNAIFANTAFGCGGGIAAIAHTGGVVARNSIYQNGAAGGGGGICFTNSIGNSNVAEVRNNLIYNNTAGGGVLVYWTPTLMEHNTLYGNAGYGIFVEGGYPNSQIPTIRDSIIVSNTGLGVNKTNGDGGIVLSTYSDIWGNNSGGTQYGVWAAPSTGVITANPQFVSPGADFHLQPTSPAVDAVPASVTSAADDYAGLARPFGPNADTGAHEYYVGTCFARLNGAGQVYSEVQTAVNASTLATDTVYVAGVCQGVSSVSPGAETFTQTLYLDKALNLRGGYTLTNWATSYPVSSPTVLDARSLGRVAYISTTGAVTLEALRLTNGYAADSGGGVYVVTGTSVLSSVMVLSNTAAYGGGVYNANGMVTVRGSDLSGNSATTEGGGLYNLVGALTLYRTSLYSNTASGGAGLYNNGGTAIVQANRIYSNRATANGGGLYNASDAVAVLQNNMVYTNTADYGGAAYLDGLVTLENNTLYGNRAGQSGGALYQTGGTVGITNTLLVSNTAGNAGGGIFAVSVTPTMDYDDVWGNVAPTAPDYSSNVFPGAHSLASDPLFAAVASFDLHLMPDSPVIDAGVPIPGLTTDIDDNSRPLGGGYDIGAVEHAPAFAPDRTSVGLPGTTVVYAHIITNTGSLADTFTFTYSNSSALWMATALPPVTLGPNSWQNVYVSVTVPLNTLSGLSNTTVVTATMQTSQRAIGKVVDTTFVAQVVSVTLSAGLDSNQSPGQTFTYTHWITNLGNLTDTFTLDLSGPWVRLAMTSPVTLGPALPGYTNSQQVVITGTVPLTAPAFFATTAFLYATSFSDGSTQAVLEDTTTAKATLGDRYVRNTGIRSDVLNNCTVSDVPCATVAHGVEQAGAGDTVKVAAGTYSGGELRINKNITLMGGYSPSWTGSRDPNFNITILDGGGTGRVIYIPGFGLQPVLDGFTIQNGRADGVGGGLYVEISAEPKLSNVKFFNNQADSSGGAIYMGGGSLYLENVVFDGNTATRGAGLYNAGATLTFSATQFLNGLATGEGGGLYNAGGALTVEGHSVVKNNWATTGGGVYHVGGGLVVMNSRIVSNTATTRGGGLYSGGGPATLFNNLVYSNTSSGNGAGLYFSTGVITFENNTLYANLAAGTGGGIYAAAASAMITNNLIIQNVASSYGGLYAGAATSADYNDAWANLPGNSNVFLGLHSFSADPLFEDPSSADFSLTDNSPAIDKGDPNTRLDLDYAYDPRPAGQGFDIGAYELGGCYARVNHSGVDGPIYLNVQDAVNTVQVYTDVVKVAGICRGVHPLQVGNATVYQAIHLTQTFILRGGYSANIWNEPPQGLPAVINAQGLGRAIYISGTIQPFIENVILLNGSATGLGGGPGGLDAGGALYNSGGRATLSGTTFFNGSALFGGGGYNGNSGVMTLTQSTVGPNTAGQAGGGLYNDDGRLIVVGAVITANTTSGNGGGVFNSPYGTLVLSRTAILSNNAAKGGGLYNDSGAATLQANTIRANGAVTAGGVGGGVYVAGGSLLLQNNMILSNTATLSGGGAYLASGSVNTGFNTWYANAATANGGAVYNASSGLELNNSILISNTASNGKSLYNAGTATLDYDDVSLADVAGTVSFGSHNFFADPGFVSPLAGDLHLREGSAAMDRGDPNATVTTDMEGDPRPSMFGFDVGADEIGGCYVRLNEGTTTYGSLSKVIGMSKTVTDVVKIAGRCIGVQPVLNGGSLYTQTLYLTKTLTLRGGYSPTNWIVSDPYAFPTTLDALGLGRVVVVSGTITPTLDGLVLSRGAAALGGGVNVGGGVYVLGGSPTFSRTTIMSGTAQWGGGLYNAAGSVTVMNGVLIGNSATNGGGVYNNNGSLTVRRTAVYSNTATSGGGIYNAAFALLYADSIYSNTAASGGGLYNSGSATLQNTMLYGNTAANGGGVYIATGSVLAQNDTFYGNRATTQGSGLYKAASATMLVTSTLVVSNTAGTGGYGIYNNAGGTTSLDYNDVFGNLPSNSNVGTGSHSLSVDPLFVNPLRFDLHLLPNSPAVDKGDPNTMLGDDWEGDLRPGLNGFDMGADELGGCLAQNARTGVVYGSVQRAVDLAVASDLIKVAGYCWGVQQRIAGSQTVSQTLYLSKALTLRGGYVASNWATSYPITQPTTLDAVGLGRVVYVSLTVPATLESLWLINGKAALGGGVSAGGAVYNLNSPLVLSHTILYSSTASFGGAVYNSGGQPLLQGNVIYGNTAAQNGGGFYNASGSPSLQNNVFYSNTAVVFGGAVHVAGGSASIVNNTLYGNRANMGGAVSNAATGLALVNTILANNTATGASGGLRDSGSGSRVDYNLWWNNIPNASNVSTGTHSLTGDPQFSDLTQSDFHLRITSPAIDVGDPATVVNVDMDNEPRPMQAGFDLGADEYGGCYARLNHLGYDYPIVYNVQDAINAASLPTDTVKVVGTCWGVRNIGGAMQAAYINKVLTLRGGYSLTDWNTADPDSHLTILDARRRGRVVYVGPVTATLSGFTLQGGDASQAGVDSTVGGGVYNNGGILTLQSDQIYSNTAMFGGGVYNNTGRVVMSLGQVTHNQATNSGGGVYNNLGHMNWNDNSIYWNSANLGGGMYNNSGSLLLYLTPVRYNTASSDGGGIYNSTGFITTTDSGCGGCSEIEYNTSGGNGGGAYLNGGSLTGGIDWFNNNTAASSGGAIYSSGAIFRFEAGRFMYNTALHGNGGAMVQTGGAASSIMQNFLTVGNTAAEGDGGGYHTDGGSMLVLNNTMVRNSARNAGGGLYGLNATLRVTNTILVSNTVTAATSGSGGGLQCTGGACSEEHNDIWNNSAALNSDSSLPPGLGTLHVDPRFRDPLSDFQLQYTSPCIDTGVTIPVPPALAAADALGVSRPQGAEWDMGRYEFQSNELVEVSNSTLYADPGQTVVHSSMIWNRGGITDSFTISVTGLWLTGTFPAVTPPMGPNQWWSFNVTVTVPLTATVCDESLVHVRAVSTRNPAATGEGIATTYVNLVPIMTLTPDPNLGSAQPGQTITYTHVLSNNTNTCGPALYSVSFVNSQYSWSSLSTPQIVTLTRGTTTTVQVPVNLYTWAPAGVVDQATVRASLVISPINFLIAADHTTILALPATRYVATNGIDNSNCADSEHGACATVQYAVSQASPGDEIHVAQGTYTGTLSVGKTVILQGGYTSTNWSALPAPIVQPAILDAQSNGRVISMSGSITPTVFGFQIVNGSAPDGGGIYADVLSATLAANSIYGNQAGNNGGGVYVLAGNVLLQNNVVYNNTAYGNGGALYVNGDLTRLENNTLYGNTALSTGSGVYNASGATMWITNTIVAGNMSGMGGYGIYDNNGVAVTMDYDDVYDNSPSDSNVPIGTHSISADPQFVNVGAGDFHLVADSLAIDHGVALADLETDLEGDGRPQINGYDIGADELRVVPIVRLTPSTYSRSTTVSPIYYQHVLTNAGNYTDTVSLAAAIDPPTWGLSIAPSPNVTLDPGMATTVWVTVTVPGGTLTGTVASATITATSGLSTSVRAIAVDTTFYQEDSDVAIVKHVTPASGWLGPGSAVTYTLVYSTNGPASAYGATITDIVPTVLTNVQFITSGIGLAPTADITYAWSVQPFGIGQVGAITITGKVKTVAQGLSQEVAPIVNTAQITTTQRDLTPTNNLSSITHWLDSAPPNVPGNALLSPSNGTQTTTTAISFVWKSFDDRFGTLDGSGVVSYQLVISSVQGSSYWSSFTVYSPTTSYAMPDLPRGSVYHWMVRAFDAVGNAGLFAPPSSLAVDLPGLTVDKRAAPANPVRGGPFTYTLTISNAGLVPATSVVLTDVLPANATRLSGGDLFDGKTLTWTISTIGAVSTLPVTFTVSTCQATITNTSYRVVTSTEGVNSPLGTPLVTTLVPPTITADFMQSATEIGRNQTVYVTNTSTTNGGPLVTYGWNFGDGQPGAFGATASHQYTAGGTFTIRLTVTDTCGIAQTATHTVTVYAPSIALNKTALATVPAGTPLTYTLYVTNTGYSDLSNVVLTDTLPAHITGGTAVPAPNGGNGSIAAGATITWTLGALATHSSLPVTLVVSVSSPLTNGLVLTNRAGVTSFEGVASSSSASTTVSSTVIFMITKSAPALVPAGTPITYTIRYTNTGNRNAIGIVITDALPLNIVGGYAAPAPSAGTISAGQVITWNRPAVSGNGGASSVSLIVTVTNKLPNGTVLLNTAGIRSNEGASASTAPVPVSVASAPKLTITKSNSPSGNVSLGDMITYTLRVTNTGTEDATSVVITDATPLSTTFVSAGLVSPTLGMVSVPATGGTGPVVWWLSLPITTPGGSASVTFTVRVTSSPLYNGTPIVNSGYRVTAVDANTPSTGKAVTNTVTALPALSITKKAAVTSLPSNTPLTYTIRYTNTGQGNAAGTVVTDVLPLNINPGVWSSLPFSGTPSAGQVITWRVPDVPGQGGWAALTLVVTPTRSLITGTVLLNRAGIRCTDNVSSATGPVTATTFHGDPVSLSMMPQGASVMAGFTQSYSVQATDAYGNDWDATPEVTFTPTSGAGGFFVGLPPGNHVFTATAPLGTYVVTATAPNGVPATTTVNVTLGVPVSLTLWPRNAVVTAGAWVPFTSIITDAYGNWGEGTLSTTFTAGGGNVFSGNVLSATVSGTWTVTGTHAFGATDHTAITILPGPFARLGLGSIGTQTAGVGFPLVIQALDAFGNVTPGFANTITLTDSTRTLLPTTWSTWSNGRATPVVTLTRALTGDRITVTLSVTPTVWVASNLFTVLPNVPASIALNVGPAAIPLGATARLTATVRDAFTNPVRPGTVVTFTTTAGALPNGQASYTATTTSGIATAVLTATCTAQSITLSARAGMALTQTNASFVAPGVPASIALTLQSNTLPVGGATTTLSATLRDCGGNLAGNGIPVTFGSAPSVGVAPNPAATVNGVAAATLASPNIAGTATLTATSSTLQALPVSITFTPLGPSTVTVMAAPGMITPAATSNIRATVTDRYGNLVSDGTPVNFAATLGLMTPTVTNTVSGLARAVFTAGKIEGQAVITATSGVGARGTATVTIKSGVYYVYLPLVMNSYVPGKNLTLTSLVATPTNLAATSVTIKNTGDVAVTEQFWVILYVDPTSPVQLDKFWWEVGSTKGISWRVTTPIPAGQTLTLTASDSFVDAARTSWPPTLGTHTLWVQADAYGGPFGLVKETNESDNIYGPVTLNVP